MLPTGAPVADPSNLVGSVGHLWPWLAGAAAFMGVCYVLATMLAGVSTMRYAIVGFFGRRGQGKSFSAVYYARKWAHTYPDKDVWTNMARLDVDGREVCVGKPREWGAVVTGDGRTKRDAGFLLRHHLHNPRDCWWCGGNSNHEGEHSAAACNRCELVECDRPLGAGRLVRGKGREQVGAYCELGDRKPVPLVHVESEYLDFAHAYDGLVFVDEAGQVFASTMWSRLPFAAVKFMADTRKRRLLLLYTAHTAARVSKNLRELTDESFECKNFKGFGFFRIKHYSDGAPGQGEQDHTAYVPFLKSVQDAYDTEEIVTPPGGLVSMSEAIGRKELKAGAAAA